MSFGMFITGGRRIYFIMYEFDFDRERQLRLLGQKLADTEGFDA